MADPEGFFAHCSRCLAPAPASNEEFNAWELLRGEPGVKAEFVCRGCLAPGDRARVTQGVSNAMMRLQRAQDGESRRRREADGG